MESIVLGGGCFWCVETIFKNLNGVVAATSGYAGGHTPNPTYNDVCGGNTGHAEVVKVDFDPDQISLEEILQVFFAHHDPTTPNQQGADIGTQYRSAIYFISAEQKRIVENVIDILNSSNAFGAPIVTEVKLLEKFFEAEDYHQDYFAKNPQNSYCQFVIRPKLEKFLKEGK